LHDTRLEVGRRIDDFLARLNAAEWEGWLRLQVEAAGITRMKPSGR
jgi:hypothetical protein